MIPNEFIQTLLSRVDVVAVVDRYVPLKKAGTNFVACCPFHSEKTPSFTVSPTKQFYHCFGCGAHGTAISFLMEFGGKPFPDAVEELARDAGLEVPRTQVPPASGGHDEALDLSGVLGVGRREDHEVDGTVPKDAGKVRGKGHIEFVGVRSMLLAASDRIHDANDIGADHLPQDVLAPPSKSDDGRVFRANSRRRRTHPRNSIT